MREVASLQSLTAAKTRSGPPVKAHNANAIRTLATLAGLMLTLPVDALAVAAALASRGRQPDALQPVPFRRTILITGPR